MDERLNVFIDTNVFLDYIQRRPVGFMEAYSIFSLAATNDIILMVSDLSIANSKYSTRKTIPIADFYAAIKSLRELFTIVPVGESAIDHALTLEAKDFEDALQYFSAKQAGAHCLLTRNMKDFYFASDIEVVGPKDFLVKYFPEI